MTEMSYPPSVDVGNLSALGADIAEHLTAAGLAGDPALRQALKLAEETGEFVGAVLRYSGMARRSGPFSDVRKELADVLLTALTVAAAFDIDPREALQEKVNEVYSRGWRETRDESEAGAR